MSLVHFYNLFGPLLRVEDHVHLFQFFDSKQQKSSFNIRTELFQSLTFNVLIRILIFMWGMLQNSAHSLSVSHLVSCLFPTALLLGARCSVRCGCVMPPLMACEVGPFPNGLFCHPAQHWMTCRQRPSPPSHRFSLCPDQVAISWTGEVTAALTCVSTGLQRCRFDQTSTGSGRCQDGDPTWMASELSAWHGSGEMVTASVKSWQNCTPIALLSQDSVRAQWNVIDCFLLIAALK